MTDVTCEFRDGAWHGVCECGWKKSSSRSGNSGSSARDYVEAHSRKHLKDNHGASAPLRVVRGRMLTLFGINERLLSKDERERYLELTAAASFRNGGSNGDRPSIRPKFRDFGRTVVASMLWVAAVGIALYFAAEEDKTPEPHPDPFLWIMLTVMFGGIAVLVMAAASDSRRWSRSLVSDYLEGIEFRERRLSGKGPTGADNRDAGPDYWATGTYDPDRYYRETRGWSKEYRDYVKDAYGDLDTYESNKPD